MSDIQPQPRVSLYSQLQRTRSWVTLIIGSIFSVVIIGFQAAQFINTLATKQQVEDNRTYIISENLKLQREIDIATQYNEILQNKLYEVETALEDHLEKHVGRLAAERTIDKRKAALAAREARRKFKEALQQGKTLKEAVDSTYDPFF